MEPKDQGLKKMIFLTTTWKFAPSFPGHALYIITFYHLKNPQGLITRAQEQCWQQAIVFFKELRGVLWARLIQDLIQLLTQT